MLFTGNDRYPKVFLEKTNKKFEMGKIRYIRKIEMDFIKFYFY